MQRPGLEAVAIVVGIVWMVGVVIAIGGWDAGGLGETLLIALGLPPVVGGVMHLYTSKRTQGDAR